MKKLLALLLLSPFIYSQESKEICHAYVSEIDGDNVDAIIFKKKCVVNMVLDVYVLRHDLQNHTGVSLKEKLRRISTKWCRFDRNIDISDNAFSCVLHSNKPRKQRLIPR